MMSGPASLTEQDYLTILGFIEALNRCQSTGEMETLFDSELLPMLKGDSCLYAWVDPDFNKTSLVGVVNIPEHTLKVYNDLLPRDPVIKYSLEKSRGVVAYDIDLPRSTLHKTVNKFLEENPELTPEEHPYFSKLENVIAAFDLPTPSVGLGVHRLKSSPEPWTFKEVRILELLRPHIIHSIKSLGMKFELERNQALNKTLIDIPTPIVIFDHNDQIYARNPAFEKWARQGGEEQIVDQLTRLKLRGDQNQEDAIDQIKETDPNLPLLTRNDGVFHLEITRTDNITGIAGYLWVVKIHSPNGAYAQANLNMQNAGLSKREMEICYLAKGGVKVKEIAERLFISPRTVETHLKNIYNKMNVHSRTELFSKMSNEN